MKLIHYSDSPLKKVWTIVQYEPEHISEYDKPNGLWVSVIGEGDWLSWCQSENFYTSSMKWENEIVLKKENKVLHLSNRKELLEFQEENGLKSSWSNRYGIDWIKVSKKYQGLIIAPYDYESRWDISWYYTWDCASGCIWDSDAVGEVVSEETKVIRSEKG